MHLIAYNTDAKRTALSPQGGTAVLFETTQRAIVFIDGSNWYHKLRRLLEIKPPTNFELRKFSERLTAQNDLIDIRYYVGKVRRFPGNPKSATMYANQQRLVTHLQATNIQIYFGHLINYPDGSFHEKGVDVLLAVEMIKLAFEDRYDIAYLISSDTDLVPAVEACQKLGRTIVYVGSALHGRSIGLTKACDKTILLRPNDVLPFMPERIV